MLLRGPNSLTRLTKTKMDHYVGRRVLAMRFICKTILAPTAIGCAVYHLASWFGLAYKPLLVLCGVIVGWPIKISLRVRYEDWRRTHKAKALSAVTASESPGKSFYDISALRELHRMDKNGFIGEFVCLTLWRAAHRVFERNSLCLIGEWFEDRYEKIGSGTFAGMLMGNYFISTADPGNIKVILTTEFNNFEKGTPDHIPMRRSLTVPLNRFPST